MPARKIAVTTHKGGTGKTVTSMALASALARSDKRCLLIDPDPQAHSCIGLGVDLPEGHPTLNEYFAEHPRREFRDVILDTHLAGLQIAPSEIRLAWTAEALSGRPKKEEYLKRGIGSVENDYDWIVMDCPPTLGVLTQNALVAADFVVIPSETGARAGEALVDLLELVRLLKGDSFESFGILFTKVDTRTTISIDYVRNALADYEAKIFKTEIPRSEPLNQAQMEQTDIYTFQPNSKGALAYQKFAKELEHHHG